jgi:hypothetical protein
MSVNSFNASNPPLTTKGDLYGFSTVPARIAVGANDTVLTADSSTATGLKWAAPAGATSAYTAINSGGTAMTGATTITVSGISGYNTLYIFVQSASAGASSNIGVRINANTGNNYYAVGQQTTGNASYSNTLFTQWNNWGDTRFILAGQSNSGLDTFSGYMRIDAANTSGVKMMQSTGGATNDNGSNSIALTTGGYWNNTALVTSISLVSSSGNFDAGTLYVFGAA